MRQTNATAFNIPIIYRLTDREMNAIATQISDQKRAGMMAPSLDDKHHRDGGTQFFFTSIMPLTVLNTTMSRSFIRKMVLRVAAMPPKITQDALRLGYDSKVLDRPRVVLWPVICSYSEDFGIEGAYDDFIVLLTNSDTLALMRRVSENYFNAVPAKKMLIKGRADDAEHTINSISQKVFRKIASHFYPVINSYALTLSNARTIAQLCSEGYIAKSDSSLADAIRTVGYPAAQLAGLKTIAGAVEDEAIVLFTQWAKNVPNQSWYFRAVKGKLSMLANATKIAGKIIKHPAMLIIVGLLSICDFGAEEKEIKKTE